MKKLLLTAALLGGWVAAQTTQSKLNGLRIHLHRTDLGHTDGWNHFRTAVMEAHRQQYGYTLTVSEGGGEGILNGWANDLYTINGGQPDSGDIDVLIFCQGEGDRNIGGGGATNPGAGGQARYQALVDHVKAGGVFITVHASGGREVSWQGWTFIAQLFTDWFVDAYQSQGGNAGHYSQGTPGDWSLDPETDATNDSSAFFIRKLLTMPSNQGGLGQPEGNSGLGEWYHFNGGTVQEDGSGGVATHANNTVQPSRVRGNQGVPSSGIGPAKIFARLTRINNNYSPPGPGRHIVWGREVSLNAFDSNAKALNGRYVNFSPGHRTNTFSQSGNWWRDMFIATLRWTVKDDLGCTNPASPSYNSFATVDDGNCQPVAIQVPMGDGERIGNITGSRSSLIVPVLMAGAHELMVTDAQGKTIFKGTGDKEKEYTLSNLASGVYLATLKANGGQWSFTLTVP